MKKFIKSFLCFAVAFVTIFSFTACKTPVSLTTTDSSKTIYNGENTNGGMTVIHDGYLYFINGTKTNDGTSAKKNTRGAICRVKLDENGEANKDTYEVVVDNLVGFDNGEIFIIGEFLYFATPNDEVNFNSSKLNYQTKFMRYDLVNKKTYEIYTTKQNSSSESISYAYYIVGEELHLVVYESTNSTITSIKVNTKCSVNYVINNVDSCVLSENFGKSVTAGQDVDANCYVYYTKNPQNYDYPQAGNYVYKTLPNKDNSSIILSNKLVVSLLSIRAGKLLYSAKSISADEDIVYFENITSNDSVLTCTNILSYTTYENVVFMENSDGTLTLVAYDSESKEIIVFTKNNESEVKISGTVVNTLSVSDANNLSFLGTVVVDEEVKNDEEENAEEPATEENQEENSEETTEENVEKVTEKVVYLVYIDSNVAYKIEIMRNGEVSKFHDPIKLSKSTVSAPSGKLVPEIVGNNLYVFAKEVKEDKESDNIYLFRIDLTITENSTSYGTMVGIVED